MSSEMTDDQLITHLTRVAVAAGRAENEEDYASYAQLLLRVTTTRDLDKFEDLVERYARGE